MVIRATARTSFVLFTLAFVASALRRVWPSPTSRWLLSNRRYLGVSYAVSHLIHLLAIFALAEWSLSRFIENSGAVVIVLGGIGYVFTAAMAATSFDRTAAWLGARRWARLHTFGAYYIWVVFFVSYVPRVAESVLYWPFALATVGALVLRLAAPALARRTHWPVLAEG